MRRDRVEVVEQRTYGQDGGTQRSVQIPRPSTIPTLFNPSPREYTEEDKDRLSRKMVGAAVDKAFTTTPFDGTNFREWALRFRMNARVTNLWEFFMTLQYPVTMAEGNMRDAMERLENLQADYSQRATLAFWVLLHSVSATIQLQLDVFQKSYSSAFEAWEYLMETYQAKDSVAKASLQKQLDNLKMGSQERVEEYFNRATAIRDKLALAGKMVDEDSFTLNLITGLPPHWEELRHSAMLHDISDSYTLQRMMIQEQRYQDLISKTNPEAEYIALFEGARLATYLRRLCEDLGFPQQEPTVIFVDNQSAIALATGEQMSQRIKHIEVHYHWMRKAVRDGVVRLEYCPTAQQAADYLTKPVTAKLHLACSLLCGLQRIPPGALSTTSQQIEDAGAALTCTGFLRGRQALELLLPSRSYWCSCHKPSAAAVKDHQLLLRETSCWGPGATAAAAMLVQPSTSAAGRHGELLQPARFRSSPPGAAARQVLLSVRCCCSSAPPGWLSHDATARLAIRNHLPATECAHFGEHRTAQALYDAVVARYSSPATAAIGRLLLPYLFPELSAFATVADLVTHLRTSDARYRATVPAEFLPTNQPPMFITLYFIVTRLPSSLRSVRDHFLTLDPTSLTVALLEQHLLAGETSAVAVGAARGTPRSPFFEGCSPSPLSSSFASAAATADVSVPEDLGAASTSTKRRNSKGKGGRGSGGGSGGGGGGSGSSSGGSGRGGGGGGGGGTSGDGGGSGGGGGGSGGSGGSVGGGTSGGRSGPLRGGPGGGRGRQ
ncbi:unnamed protein product [Closterium sp. NIES-54]